MLDAARGIERRAHNHTPVRADAFQQIGMKLLCVFCDCACTKKTHFSCGGGLVVAEVTIAGNGWWPMCESRRQAQHMEQGSSLLLGLSLLLTTTLLGEW